LVACEAGQFAVPVEGKQQRGNVAEADHEFWIAPGGREIEAVGDTIRSLAAARRKDGADFSVVQRGVEVG